MSFHHTELLENFIKNSSRDSIKFNDYLKCEFLSCSSFNQFHKYSSFCGKHIHNTWQPVKMPLWGVPAEFYIHSMDELGKVKSPSQKTASFWIFRVTFSSSFAHYTLTWTAASLIFLRRLNRPFVHGWYVFVCSFWMRWKLNSTHTLDLLHALFIF